MKLQHRSEVRYTILALGAAVLLSLACDSGAGGSPGAGAASCVPGITIACPCPGAGQGTQTCTPARTFAPCECGTTPGGSGGTGGGSGGTSATGGSGGTGGGSGGSGGTGGGSGGSGGTGGTGGFGATGGSGGTGGTAGRDAGAGTGGSSPDASVDVFRPTGAVRVTVTDISDALVAQATVRALVGGVMQGQGMTAASGTVLLSMLPGGEYEISVSAAKFDPGMRTVTVTDGATADITIQLVPSDAVPAGGTSRAASIMVRPAGGALVFEVDLFVLDRLGKPIDGLGAGAFSIDAFTLTGNTFTFTLDSMSPLAKVAKGPYSAYLMLDQSGSITGNDPGNMRLQAARIFLGKLGAGDQVVVGAFASGGLLPYDITQYGDFTTDGRSYFSTIDALASKESGGTPLYKATVSAIQTTAMSAPTMNRAALIFTDGDDTGGGWTIDQVITESKSKGVPLHMVGLGTGTRVDVLGKMANRTGGTYMQASRAGELIALYGNLGALLRGATGGYRTRWTVTRSPTSFAAQTGWFSTSINVDIGGGEVIWVPIYIEYPGTP